MSRNAVPHENNTKILGLLTITHSLIMIEAILALVIWNGKVGGVDYACISHKFRR